MYQKGDLIIYGNKGVCEVTDISTIDISGISKGKLYYILRPIKDRGGTIFAPVDSEKTPTRPILTRDEAMELVDSLNTLGNILITDERQREDNYKAAVNSCDCREWVRMIRTLWIRNQERLARGKKTTAIDKKYCKIAEDNLYSELAVSLEMEISEARALIVQRMDLQEHTGV